MRGLLHSFFVYYGVPFRFYKMRRFYRTFIRPGSLCFDIGSHLGNRIRVWRSLGATVVAAEPSPHCYRFIERMYARREEVTVLPIAVGARRGEAVLNISESHPTLSTMSEAWIEQVKTVPSFEGISWDRHVTVETDTLDGLIGKFGTPDFIKIDVEGFEAEALKGLSVPVAAVSFEYLPASIEVALEALSRIDKLGEYEYNLSPIETMKLLWEEWKSAPEVEAYLRRQGRTASSGDIYARLQGTWR